MPKRSTPDWENYEVDILEQLAPSVMEGGKTWEDIAMELPGRTAEACRKKWRRIEEVEEELIPQTGELRMEDVFYFIRNKPKSVSEICNKFDRGPDAIIEILEKMDSKGYTIIRTQQDKWLVDTVGKPKVEPPDINIADMTGGREFNIAVASDAHHASRHMQATSRNKFIRYAYEEYGVRHVFDPGDVFTGVYTYRGHPEDVIPLARPLSRKLAWQSVDYQVELADHCTPKLDGLTYYVLGGNHDWTFIKVAGRNGVKLLCDQREDMVYCGYHVAGIPLTPKAHVRMWHMRGGPSYARSYKVQKGMESLAFEALKEAMREDMPPITSILMVGHLHMMDYSMEPPLHGFLSGCFEGQTNYMKEKSLVPHIGGIILGLKLNDKGKVFQVSYTPVLFEEQKDDWKEWEIPPLNLDPVGEPDPIDYVFEAQGEIPEEDPA